MHKWYKHNGPNIGISAEDGFFYRNNSLDKDLEDW